MKRRALSGSVALLSLCLMSCASSSDVSRPDAGQPRRGIYTNQTPLPWASCPTDAKPPDNATVVEAFKRVDQYLATGDDRREVDGAVDFPASGNWARIDLRIEVTCPAKGHCDAWDRNAALFLVGAPGAADEQLIELERYITPYGVPMCLTTDVTDFASLLVGRKTLRSAIDTEVGPASTRYGNGWRTSVTFVFHPDTSPHGANEVIPVIAGVQVMLGDPETAQEALRSVMIPADAYKVEMRVLSTGHGQANLDNCGEFCQLDRAVEVNGTPFHQTVWRYDCEQNPLNNQLGNWQGGPRAGWCPGAYVVPEVFDITSALKIGAMNDIQYVARQLDSGAPYVNTCRPGAGDANNHCEGCLFKPDDPGNCEYNGIEHTPPKDRLSVALFIYR